MSPALVLETVVLLRHDDSFVHAHTNISGEGSPVSNPVPEGAGIV